MNEQAPETYLPKELAIEMAYAEQPYREMAKVALKDGNPHFVDQALAAGEKASESAGTVYLSGLLKLVKRAEAIPINDPELTLAQNVIIHKYDFVEFVNSVEQKTEENNGKSGRLWALIASLKMERRADDTSFSREFLSTEAQQTKTVKLSDLIIIVRYLEDQVAKYPQLTESSILGRGWGPKSVDYFKRFTLLKTRELGRD
jgi:hypothetical protein